MQHRTPDKPDRFSGMTVGFLVGWRGAVK